jgi:co-chaperonin GroES (HSP10)
MKPLHSLVLIRIETNDVTASGIITTGLSKSRPPEGVVEAVGPEVTSVQVGDKVLFSRYGSINTSDKDLRLCQEAHVLAVL